MCEVVIGSRSYKSAEAYPGCEIELADFFLERHLLEDRLCTARCFSAYDWTLSEGASRIKKRRGNRDLHNDECSYGA